MNSDHFTPDTPPAPDAPPELAVSSAPDEETIPAPPPRPRRRRAAPVATPAAEVPEAAPAAEAPDVAPAVEAPEVAPGGPIGEVSAPPAEEALVTTGAAAGEVAEEGPPVGTRKPRRRNRRGRGVAAEGAGEAGAPADAEATPVAMQEADLAELDLSTPEPEEALPLSPAVLRRFDHRNWRERPGRLGPTAPTGAGPAPTPEPGTPVPFERRIERGPRYGARPRAAAETA